VVATRTRAEYVCDVRDQRAPDLAELSAAARPAVREVLARVADDEARHAELAWQFLKWALPRCVGVLAERLRRSLPSRFALGLPRS
jgi:hypothetical protein